MPSFKNLADLNKYINTKLIQSMDKVGETAKQHMYDYVKKEMESRPEDKLVYERTWEYLNSISRTKATYVYGAIVVFIEYNTDKIHPYITTDGTFNQHADLWNEDTSDFIPLWLEFGTDNDIHSHKPVGGLIDLEKWVKLNFKKELMNELRKLGIQTK